MYVCICQGVTERAIVEAARSGARTLSDLSAMTGCATSCGSCGELAVEILQRTRAVAVPLDLPILQAA